MRFNNPAGVSTGGYGDGNCADERLWAAAELARTTGDAVYEKYFLDRYGDFKNSIRATNPQTWGNVANLALWTYVLGKGSNAEAARVIRDASLKAADEIVARTAALGYRDSMTTRDYNWGSQQETPATTACNCWWPTPSRATRVTCRRRSTSCTTCSAGTRFPCPMSRRRGRSGRNIRTIG